MGFVEIKVREYRIELGGKGCHVVSPKLAVRKLFSTAHAGGDWQIWGDRSGFQELAKLAMVAAINPSAIVFVPKSGDTVRFQQDHYSAHDIVIVHHTAQMAPSRWKEIRGRLEKGALATKSIPKPDPDAVRPLIHWGAQPSDPVDIFQHSNTLFIVSSKPTLTYLANELQSLSRCHYTGDHSHLMSLLRNGGRDAKEDLTMVFAAPEDWGSGPRNA
jgi:hypothetical protein